MLGKSIEFLEDIISILGEQPVGDENDVDAFGMDAHTRRRLRVDRLLQPRGKKKPRKPMRTKMPHSLARIPRLGNEEIVNSSLRRRGYLAESVRVLKKAPPKTAVADVYGLRFSSWDGKLALVTTSALSAFSSGEHISQWFNPETLAQRYVVRFAVDSRGKPIPVTNSSWIGAQPYLADAHLPYEKNTFKLGSRGYGMRAEVEGSFSKPQEFWVKKSFKNLDGAQTNVVEHYFRKRGFIDVSDFKLTVRDWRIMLGMGFDEIQEKLHYEKAKEADYLVTRILGHSTIDDSLMNRVWKGIKGVYALTRQGKIKFAVER